MNDQWEAIIGLEIHIQLNTKTKLFSPAPNAFGQEPNQNISVICTGQPGSLPLLNREAVKKAVQFGLAVGAKIQKHSSFDRKSYFYPDSPRNFQITQFFHPILLGGSVTIQLESEGKAFEKVIDIQSAHLEDDAGNLRHFSAFSGVDDNRAGAPLLEIVSEPCLRSGQEAALYAQAIRSVFQYLEASEGNLDQGQMRMDANISVRRKGESSLRNKVEIKNMNSFHFLEMAIEEETTRQIALYEKDPNAIIPSSTCRFDPATKTIAVMRVKESTGDYRYMPEPDIPPVVIEDLFIEELQQSLPELAPARKKRYIETMNLSPSSASLLTLDKKLSDYFEQALASCKSPKMLANWITVEFAGKLKPLGKTLLHTNIPPASLGQLVHLIETGKITARMGKDIGDEMIEYPRKTPKEIVENNPNYAPIDDPKALSPLIDAILEANPQSITDFKQGRKKAFAFLVGQVMKTTKGKADPSLVSRLIEKKLDANP
ncbi:MAG: Asp-tRNA(Asn)/Glu-tRNA(Gln) amidotransferase subunit GatB [Chlamydiota bacterium]